jgi:cytoskeletal protein CcmA (bactofilin family)
MTTNAGSTTKPDIEERRVHAWIGQGVTIEGTIKSSQDLRIDGTVKGAIEAANHGLIVGASGKIDGNLVAKSIIVSGKVTGDLTATDRIDVQDTGWVDGNLTAPRLVVVDGAHLLGKIDVPGTRGAQRR